MVVLDEAYGEFVTSPAWEDSASWVADHPNLVILRTFSKIYGLAGLRLGYGIAHPDVVKALDKLRQPFNVDSLAQVAAAEALRHPERIREAPANCSRAERARMARQSRADGHRFQPERGQLSCWST